MRRCDIYFTDFAEKNTTAGRINQILNQKWDDTVVLVFPLVNIPDGLNRSDIESGIGNYLISQGVPILDYYLQFTELSGRHSVLERPLSESKRPLIFN